MFKFEIDIKCDIIIFKLNIWCLDINSSNNMALKTNF